MISKARKEYISEISRELFKKMSGTKKSIFIIIDGFLPGKKYGGPVTSLVNFADYLSDTYDIFVICFDHDLNETTRYAGINDEWNKVGNTNVLYLREPEYGEQAIESIISEFEGQIAMFYLSGVYSIGMNTPAINVAKKKGIPVVLAPRGGVMKNVITMKGFKKMMKKEVFLFLSRTFKTFKGIYFQTTSDDETKDLKHYLRIKDEYIFQLENFPTSKKSRDGYIKEKDWLKIIFVSRLEVKKNLYSALEAVKSMDDNYHVEFDIYGPKEDPVYWEKCETLINEINSTKSKFHVEYKGALDPVEAKKVYLNYDCFLFPTLSENYGHVIVESIFSGCPVVLSKGTTPFDDITGNGGFIAELNNPKEFAEHLNSIAKMNNEDYLLLCSQLSNYVDKKFDVVKLKRGYINMIESLR